MTTRKNWTTEQTEAVVMLYNHMLELQRQNKLGPGKGKQSKAKLVRAFTARYPDRSRGSVEMKLMNVSHCRQLMGLAIVTGYKPLSNASTDLVAMFQNAGGDQ